MINFNNPNQSLSDVDCEGSTSASPAKPIRFIAARGDEPSGCFSKRQIGAREYHLAPSARSLRIDHHEVNFGTTSLIRVNLSSAEGFMMTAEPLTSGYLFKLPTTGTWQIDVMGCSAEAKPGDVIVVNPGDVIRESWVGNGSQIWIRMDRSLLESVVTRNLRSHPAFPIRFKSVACDPGLRPWVEVIIRTLAGDGRPSVLGKDRRVRSCLEQALVSLALAGLPHTETSAFRERDAQIAPHFLKLAESYIHSHIQCDVTIDQLIAAGGVSARTLYYGFKAWRSTSPMKFIRNAKLDWVRKRLSNQNSPVSTVSAVASDAGFTNFGQFAALYRAKFGETPSATLKFGRKAGSVRNEDTVCLKPNRMTIGKLPTEIGASSLGGSIRMTNYEACRSHVLGSSGTQHFVVNDPSRFRQLVQHWLYLGRIRIDWVRMDAPRGFKSTYEAGGDEFIFHFVIKGHGAVKEGSSVLIDVGPGDTFINNPKTASSEFWAEECEQLVVRVKREILEYFFSRELSKRCTGRLYFEPVAMDCGFAALLLPLFAKYDGIRVGTPIIHDSHVSSEVERTIVAMLLAGLAHTKSDHLALHGPAIVPYYVKRAEVYIRKHAANDVTMADIVAAACVSERSLFYGFRRWRQTTPMEYVWDIRLQTARVALTRASRVGQAAVNSGFTSFSHFSKMYKARFGESPSTTRRGLGVPVG